MVSTLPFRRAALCAAGLTVVAAACHRPAPQPSPAAIVDDEPITRAAFAAELERNMARYRGQEQPLPAGIEVRIQESVLGRMIEERALAHRAKALGVQVGDADVDARYREHRGRFASDEAFANFLSRSHTNAEILREDLRRELVRDRVVERLAGEVAVSDQDVAAYYQANPARFREPEAIRARRILLRLAASAEPAERQKRRREAAALARQLQHSRADFPRLARAHSEGPEAAAGGDLGAPFPRGRMSPEFDDGAFRLAAGELSAPLETRAGIELVEVLERLPERTRPLAEVHDGLRASLVARARNDRRRDILQQVKHEARIERLMAFTPPAPPAAPTQPGPAAAPAAAPAPQQAP